MAQHRYQANDGDSRAWAGDGRAQEPEIGMRDVGFCVVFAFTALCTGEQPGTEGPACQHLLLSACGAEPGGCVEGDRGLSPPGMQVQCNALYVDSLGLS